MELSLTEFNPTVADLQALVADAGMLTLPDPTDEVQLKAVKTKRIELRDARVKVEKAGKALRQGAIDFQKQVIEREKELIGIIEPEEERLSALEEEAKHKLLIAKRTASLPARHAKLAEIGITDMKDETLLDLDDEQFEGFYNKCVADKNAKDAADLKAREDAVKAAEEKQRHEAEMKEREEAAKKNAEERAARELEESKKREEEAKLRAAAAEERAVLAKETADREAKERQEREAAAKAEAERVEREKLAKEERVRSTLEMYGYTEETKSDFIIQRKESTVELFKKIASFDIS